MSGVEIGVARPDERRAALRLLDLALAPSDQRARAEAPDRAPSAGDLGSGPGGVLFVARDADGDVVGVAGFAFPPRARTVHGLESFLGLGREPRLAAQWAAQRGEAPRVHAPLERWWDHLGTAAVLAGVAVIPERRREGIARRLAERRVAEARARGATAVFVDTGVGHGTPELYAALGFTPLLDVRMAEDEVHRLLALELAAPPPGPRPFADFDVPVEEPPALPFRVVRDLLLAASGGFCAALLWGLDTAVWVPVAVGATHLAVGRLRPTPPKRWRLEHTTLVESCGDVERRLDLATEVRVIRWATALQLYTDAGRMFVDGLTPDDVHRLVQRAYVVSGGRLTSRDG